MTILANGKARDVADGTTIASFLDDLGWKPGWVVVELNGDPISRASFEQTVLAPGDRLEVVRAVAGG